MKAYIIWENQSAYYGNDIFVFCFGRLVDVVLQVDLQVPHYFLFQVGFFVSSISVYPFDIRSLLNHVPCISACQHGLCAKVLACQRGLCASVLSCKHANVLTCRKHANLFLHASVPVNVPTSHKV